MVILVSRGGEGVSKRGDERARERVGMGQRRELVY